MNENEFYQTRCQRPKDFTKHQTQEINKIIHYTASPSKQVTLHHAKLCQRGAVFTCKSFLLNLKALESACNR